MMLVSNAAAHAFEPNGLGAFRPKKKILIPIPTRGMGLTEAEISAALIGGAGPETAAWQARYGAGGSYSREASVVTAAREEQVERDLPESSGPASLYVAAQCGPSDAACIAENERRQQANMALIQNANREFNMQVCRSNAAMNPGTVNDRDCTGLYSPLPVPPATGPKVLVAPSGGSYSVPVEAGTPAQQQAAATAWAAQQKVMAAQEAASAAANKPNQTVAPKGQPGEVTTGGSGITAAELAAILAAQNSPGGGGEAAAPFSLVGADGKIMGLEPMTLALIAAGVGALMLLKK
jgi:hypothetical protein